MAEAITDRGPAESPDPKGSQDGKATTRKLEAFLRDVVKKFNRVEAAEAINRREALEDDKFRKGDQWPEQIRAQRTIEQRPCLTINKINGFVHQVCNDQRQNRPSINISPVGDRSDPETARMLKGLIRQIERVSTADVAYDTGFESAVSGGWGYWRIYTDYEDEDTFDQVIKIGRIRNRFRVYMDPDCQESDASDAKFCFISDMLTKDEFEEMYPDAVVFPWTEGSTGDEYKGWNTSTHVRVAEYFCIETEERTLVFLENGHTGWEDELDESLKNAKKVKERKVSRKKVKWYKLTCREILDEGEWPGKWIPVVRVIGDEVDIEGKPSFSGLVRYAKDPQRMYNFWVTSETELIALAPKAPWIMEEGQIEGHEQRWKQANTKSLPYLLYRGSSISGKPAPPPQRQQFAGPPAGVVQAKLAAAQDMQAATGIRFDATLQERNYDESGKALRELKRVGDLGNFHYVDNLSRSLRFTGKILIDLIPKIYDTPRIVTILREDDTEEQVKIDPNLGQPHGEMMTDQGKIQRLFNPKLGDYEVAVTIGPSFATKRVEAAENLINFMKVIPNQAPLIADLVAKNQDWPGAEELHERLQSQLPPGLLDKSIKRLPPEARGQVLQLKQHLQETQAQLKQAAAMLGDQDKDRQVDLRKIEHDFEAKMTKALLDFEAKMHGGGKSEQTEIHKIERDFEAKVLKVLLDHGVNAAKLDSAHMLGEAKVASAHMLGEAKNESTSALARDKQQSKSGGSSRGDSGVSAAVVSALEQLANALAAPRETTLIRDKDGKAVGAISAPASNTLQ